MPFVRIALLCTCLTSSKHSDGISRLISKNDIDRLKGASLKSKTQEVEDLLGKAWSAKLACSLSEGDACTAFGRLCVRLVLHLLNKKDREQPFDGGFTEITELYEKELTGVVPVAIASQQAFNLAPNKKVPIQDMIHSKPAEVALIQNPHLQLGGKHLVLKLIFYGLGLAFFLMATVSNWLMWLIAEVHAQGLP